MAKRSEGIYVHLLTHKLNEERDIENMMWRGQIHKYSGSAAWDVVGVPVVMTGGFNWKMVSLQSKIYPKLEIFFLIIFILYFGSIYWAFVRWFVVNASTTEAEMVLKPPTTTCMKWNPFVDPLNESFYCPTRSSDSKECPLYLEVGKKCGYDEDTGYHSLYILFITRGRVVVTGWLAGHCVSAVGQWLIFIGCY